MALDRIAGDRISRFESYFTHHAFGFWLALCIAVVIIAGWQIVSSRREQRARAHADSVLRSVESGNVPAMLAEYLTTVRGVSAQTAEMRERINHLYENLPGLVCHTGLVRFSPFHDTGSDQSFSLALLDGKGDGVVLTALHSRHDHKLYAKPVIGRASSYPLTEEEQKAIVRSVGDAVSS